MSAFSDMLNDENYKINSKAYEIYYMNVEDDEQCYTYNSFLEWKGSLRYIKPLLREKKLKRILYSGK